MKHHIRGNAHYVIHVFACVGLGWLLREVVATTRGENFMDTFR